VAFKYGYLHHILRLMVVANFMTLSLIHPHSMYKWFMEFSLDSYDWVMLPNVHGMASYSTSLLSTKPYISSSNYVLKMSDYRKDGKWDTLWDALYYNFLFRHEQMLEGNGRLFFMLRNAKRKTEEERAELVRRADVFLATLRNVGKRKLLA
jgi:deoxyribodipyrimidine photolyase-related protein